MSDNLIIDCETGDLTTAPLSAADIAAATAAQSEQTARQAAYQARVQSHQTALATLANMKNNTDPNVSALAQAVHTLLGP